MENLETLFNLSEVAITLAGFIAVATALRASNETTAGATKVRVVNLLLSSFGILLLSQTAIALLHAEVAENLVWQISSFSWMVITVSASVYNIRNQSIMTEAGMELPLILNWIQWLVMLLVSILQVANILLFQEFWPFLVAVIIILLVAAISFTIIVLQFLKEPLK